MHVELKELRQSMEETVRRNKLTAFLGIQDEVVRVEKAHNVLWAMHRARK